MIGKKLFIDNLLSSSFKIRYYTIIKYIHERSSAKVSNSNTNGGSSILNSCAQYIVIRVLLMTVFEFNKFNHDTRSVFFYYQWRVLHKPILKLRHVMVTHCTSHFEFISYHNIHRSTMTHKCCVIQCKSKVYQSMTIEGKETKLKFNAFPQNNSVNHVKEPN